MVAVLAEQRILPELPRDGILSDEQIEQLLQEAENRLRTNAGLSPKESSLDDDIMILTTPAVKSQSHIRIPKLQHGLKPASLKADKHGVVRMENVQPLSKEQSKLADTIRVVQRGDLQEPKKTDKPTSGSQWFDMPKTELTPQLRRDLQLIELRNVLDPHRHYKKSARKGKIPQFSQTGTVVEGAAEWYSSRINRKDRSKSFVDEEMKIERDNGKHKRRYNEVQDKKTSGKKVHYKKLMEKRKRRV